MYKLIKIVFDITYPSICCTPKNCLIETSHLIIQSGIFFAILGRGPRAFQIRKISAVNH